MANPKICFEHTMIRSNTQLLDLTKTHDGYEPIRFESIQQGLANTCTTNKTDDALAYEKRDVSRDPFKADSQLEVASNRNSNDDKEIMRAKAMSPK